MNALAGMRICLVGPMPPPNGGMAMQTRQLAELLRSEQVVVELVPTNLPYRPAWVGGMKGVRALFRLVPYVTRLWRAAGRNDLMHVMANSGWSWHLFAAPAVWVGRVRRVPVVVNYRGGEAAAFLDRAGRAVATTMRRASRLVVPSGFLQEVFALHGMGAEVVPNIVDRSLFFPGEPTVPPQIIVARNLEPIYDNATALRAFAIVRTRRPDVRLLIAGTGPEAGSLHRLASELGIQAAVEFAGRLEREVMAQRLRASVVSLNPSRVDNMPNSVLEALASGVPVVSTDVGGVPYIVKHGETALLVPPGNPTRMAEAILSLLEDASLAQQLRSAGLASVAAYTWDSVGPRWGHIYRDAYQCASAV
ncbi:glycosyltransferase family 4 protein [Calidifontimicrobium sp. SYSU G02091]|uniref:glycosyltransferase family 4 protein n=1 Tax=Calidifontimicrobium sp. SYSU G02091 TaxID=2926421 RepID=UPI001F52F448|nr:glycosyltransferase family 4 protein [Calidifontimicrobium sp. SYSU G02091]MCI1193131.1 glycosyltransferase family 4 protein [Calidifontimicrobium sp. SYSU G02091]